MESSSYYCITFTSSVIISIVTVFFFYSRYKLNYWTRRGVKQIPNAHWLFGNFKEAVLFRAAPGWYLKNLYNQSENDAPYIGFYIFLKPFLQVKDPDIIKQILIRDFDKFSDRYFSGVRQRDSIGMKNLFGLRNPEWKNLRAAITSTLSIEKVKRMLPLLLENGRPMIDYVNELKLDQNGDKLMDGQDLNYRYATDIIANIGQGISTDLFKDPDAEFTKQAKLFFHSIKRFRAMLFLFFMPMIAWLGDLVYLDMSNLRKILSDAVTFREESGITRGDYIDALIKLKYSMDSLYELDDDNLLNQVGQFFPGFESGSITASFTLMEIARNPEIQALARRDVLQAVTRLGWTYEAFNEMKYLEQCVHEGMRLYPAVPFLDRCAFEDYTIPGTDVVIEKGTCVHMSLSALHRDPKHFPRPEEFDPGRFGAGVAKSDAFMPFGMGPRMCDGSKLGLLHVKVVLALILNEYGLEYRPREISKMVRLHPYSTFTVADRGLDIAFKKLQSTELKN